jgi:hypothetical protein
MNQDKIGKAAQGNDSGWEIVTGWGRLLPQGEAPPETRGAPNRRNVSWHLSLAGAESGPWSLLNSGKQPVDSA